MLDRSELAAIILQDEAWTAEGNGTSVANSMAHNNVSAPMTTMLAMSDSYIEVIWTGGM
jgi:hypothetical protein